MEKGRACCKAAARGNACTVRTVWGNYPAFTPNGTRSFALLRL